MSPYLLADITAVETAKGLSEAGIVAILIFFAILFMGAIAWLARGQRKQADAHQTHYQELLAAQETNWDKRLQDTQTRADAHKDDLVEILEKALEKSMRTEQVLAEATSVIKQAMDHQPQP